ncbi:MAG: DHH family phosphoesterase [Bacteroidetes bacterium]|nr:DHH family phosphoesterase [Bacteroidota bacterium]
MPLEISPNLDALFVRLAHPARIIITTHQKPDGDAMGSSLALWHYLNKIGQRPVFISPTTYADFLRWLPGTDQALIYTDHKERCDELIDKADVIFCLDFGELHRAADVGHRIARSAAIKVNIDHHILPPEKAFADYWYRDEKASSTCELIYDFIYHHNPDNLLDTDTATCLYTGLVTDTGAFRYSVNPRVHEVAAQLLAAGVDIDRVSFHLFSNFSENRTRFMGYALYECLHVLPQYHTAYFRLPLEAQERFQLREGDTEGLVNFALGIEGVNFAILLNEQPDMVKISFRSLGKFATNLFAAHFKGGGHHNASGGKSTESLAQTEQRLLALLEEYKTQLDYEL